MWTFCPYSGGRRGEEYSTGCQFSLDEWYVKIIAGSTKFVLRGKKVGGASYIAAIRHMLLILPCKYSLYRIVEYDMTHRGRLFRSSVGGSCIYSKLLAFFLGN
jgi:hypothetical protein